MVRGNAWVTDLTFNSTIRLVSFRTHGPPEGTARISIIMPNNFLVGPLLVNIDEQTQPYASFQNETHITLTLKFPQGPHQVEVIEPAILIDDSWVSKERVDVGSVQYVHLHSKWRHNQSSVTTGIIYVNKQPYHSNGEGWIIIQHSEEQVKKVAWTVTGVDVKGITNFEQMVSNPSIIWDSIQINLKAKDERIDVGSEGEYMFTAIYAYDMSDATLYVSLVLNDSLIKDAVGKWGFKVDAISEGQYGLTAFDANTIECIWDRIKIVEGGVSANVSVVGRMETVWFKATYEYDNEIFDGTKGTLYVNGSAMTWSTEHDRWEYNFTSDVPDSKTFQATGVLDRQYSLTKINDIARPQSITWRERSFIESPLGTATIFSAITILILATVYVLLKRRKPQQRNPTHSAYLREDKSTTH